MEEGLFEGYGEGERGEEHGSVDKMSPSLKLPKQKSEGSQLPRKQLKKNCSGKKLTAAVTTCWKKKEKGKQEDTGK